MPLGAACHVIATVQGLPEIAGQGTLIVFGPYSSVRHPMYTCVWLVTLSWMLGSALPEERLLIERFPEYETYRRQTKRLIPFVW